MTTDLDRLLEQVEDALEEGGEELWQPDLTAPVLPALTQKGGSALSEAAEENSKKTSGLEGTGVLPTVSALDEEPAAESFPATAPATPPRFLREGESLSPTTRQSDGGRLASGSVLPSSSPALLEQLQALEAVQASAQALGRSQEGGSRLPSRSLTGQNGGSISYDPAAAEDSPLAAAAAAAQDEDRARAVDRAFQRDSRRYDRGFSLY